MFDAAIPADQLLRLVIAYKGDGSWNRMDFQLQVGDQRYVSEQTSYIAQHRGASILLQPPTFLDQTLGARNWVSLAPAGRVTGPASPTQATLTLTLWPSSTLRAMWGKFQRNYSCAFRSMPFWTYVRNSLVVVILQLAGALFSSGFVGYAFARLNWPGRSLAMGILLATMMLPSQVTMIPSFLIWRDRLVQHIEPAVDRRLGWETHSSSFSWSNTCAPFPASWTMRRGSMDWTSFRYGGM